MHHFWSIVQVEGFGPTRFGYTGFHITWRSNEGIGTELQVTMPHVWQTKLMNDQLYRKWRNYDPNSLTKEQYDEQMADIATGKNMWKDLQLPNFKALADELAKKLETSSSDSSLPSQISPQVPLETGPHLPSENSLIGNEDISINLPSSVSTNIGTTPSLVERCTIFGVSFKINWLENIKALSTKFISDREKKKTFKKF